MNFLYKLFFTRLLDFEVLYKTTKDLFLGLNPYKNPEIFTGLGYPPNTLLFYFPFIFLNQDISQKIFSIFNLLALVFCVILSLKIVKERPKYWEIIIASLLLFLTFPARHTLLLGQNNFFAYFLLLLSFYLFQKKKVAFSGMSLGLAVSLKTIFGFFVIFYLLRKEFRLLFYAFLAILVNFLIIFLFFDPNLYIYWYKVVLPPLFNFEGREIISNQGISGFVSRIFENIQVRKTLTNILSGALILFTSYKTLKTKNNIASFSLFIITLNLTDSLAWQHHFVWMLLPFVYFVYSTKKPIYWVILGISYVLNLIGQNFWGTLLIYSILIPNLSALSFKKS